MGLAALQTMHPRLQGLPVQVVILCPKISEVFAHQGCPICLIKNMCGRIWMLRGG